LVFKKYSLFHIEIIHMFFCILLINTIIKVNQNPYVVQLSRQVPTHSSDEPFLSLNF
jgi:hypothetical protein